MPAFRASSAAGATSSAQVASQQLTIPAAIQAGDVMWLVVYALTTVGVASTINVSSTGTAFTLATPQVHVTNAGFTANSLLYRAVATAADAGKVITATSSDNAFWGLGLAAWSGASPSSPVDVIPAGNAVAGTSTVACPAGTTTVTGDWALYFAGVTASATTPTAPAGTTTRLTSYGGTNCGTLIADSNGSAGNAGASIGGGTFSAGATTSTWWAAFTVALRPAGVFDPYLVSTDGNGVQTWNVTYTGNQPYTFPTGSPTGTGLRILPPASPSAAYPHCFIYDLPVNSGFDDTANGNGLDTIRGLAAQNAYNATIVEPSFGISPWYADKDTDSTLHLESFMTALRDWMASSSFASGGEKHYLIGFSKSGLGGSALLFKHPDKWYAGAFWDGPFKMKTYDGQDDSFPTPPVGGSPAFNYGSDANFQANYRLSTANITTWNTAAGGVFTSSRRLWIGGYFSFQGDVTDYMSELAGLSVQYDGSWDTLDASHAWHSGWVAAGLASVIHAPPVTGTGSVAMAAMSLSGTGTVQPPPPPAVPARIWRPCYCNRYEPMRALDFAPGVDVAAAVDRAMMDAAENIEGHLHRVFYPSDDTRYMDWPTQGGTGGGQVADPWRLWLDENDLTCLTALVAGGVSLGLDQLFIAPWDNPRKGRPYYTRIEVDRSTSASFGNRQQTPQNAIAMTATWGYGADADLCGYLAADVKARAATVTLDNGSLAGPGDLLVLGYGRGTAPFPGSDPHAGAIAPYLGERVLITDVAPVSTGLTQSGSGVTTAETDDQALAWTGTGALNAGEVITLDSEDMLVEKVIGSVATVRRAFAGTTLAVHSAATIYAYRQYNVARAQLGTTGTTYSSGAAVYRHRVPSVVRGLAIAEVENQLLQEGSGYARTSGSGDNAMPAPGAGLADKWAEARTRHGRKARQRAV